MQPRGAYGAAQEPCSTQVHSIQVSGPWGRESCHLEAHGANMLELSNTQTSLNINTIKEAVRNESARAALGSCGGSARVGEASVDGSGGVKARGESRRSQTPTVHRH